MTSSSSAATASAAAPTGVACAPTTPGRPLLRQALDISGTDAVTGGPAILSGHRAVGTLLQVDPALHVDPAARIAAPPGASPPGASPWVTVMPLATGPATLVTALAHDAVTLRKFLTITR